MKTIKLKGLDISAYTETLSNGLEIVLLPYEDKKNYFITYATRYGSDVTEFEKNEVTYKPPLGIAHFLEHKMFEQESGIDPFTFFSKSGTDANASTSFDNTQYICYGTKDFSKNLKYLLNFVNSPYFTDENVDKEKGIIAEEIKMYQDMPDFKLEMKLKENIYKIQSRRNDIAGTIDEINKITKEDLNTCYENFYVPNNMFILVVGNFDKDEAIKIIKDELDYRNSNELPKIIEQEEPKEVNRKKMTIKENVEVPKIAYGIKIPINKLPLKSLELDLYLNMITTILFGASSEFRERVRVEKILNGMYKGWESTTDYKLFYIIGTSTEPDKLIKEVEYEFENLSISKKSFERIKKVWIANEVKMIDNIHATVHNLYDDMLRYKEVIPNKIEQIRNMKIDKLNKLLKSIDWDNKSIIKMEKK